MKKIQNQYYPAITKERVLAVETDDTITIKEYKEILCELSKRWNYIIHTIAKVYWWDFIGQIYDDGEYIKSVDLDYVIINGKYTVKPPFDNRFPKSWAWEEDFQEQYNKEVENYNLELKRKKEERKNAQIKLKNGKIQKVKEIKNKLTPEEIAFIKKNENLFIGNI